MKKIKKSYKIVKSINDFEKTYFPNSFKKEQLMSSQDSNALAVELAKMSIEEVKDSFFKRN